jgi:NAD(P)-dependent dehydrogenase (short-subunit alcohol dehydrogenase family)
MRALFTVKFEDLTDRQVDFDLKVFAAIRLARLAFPEMNQRRWGRIINVLNIGAKTPGPGSASTRVIRAAANGFDEGAGERHLRGKPEASSGAPAPALRIESEPDIIWSEKRAIMSIVG